MATALSHEWAVERSAEILERRAQRRRGGGGAAQRRRGSELDDAILDAAWAELVSVGYARLTYDAIARRAETSRTVIYRRWPTLGSLVAEAIARRPGGRLPLPDTGCLRGDLIEFLAAVAALGDELMALASVRLTDHFERPDREAPGGSGPAFMPSAEAGLPMLYLRAQQRGEVNLTGVPQRVLNLPGDLMLGDILARLRPPTDEDIAEIIDDIFYPVLRAYGALPGK